MTCATGNDPALSMRRRISAYSGIIDVRIGAASALFMIEPGAAPHRHGHERQACDHQRQRQQHSHGQAAPEKADLHVGLAKQLADGTCDGITDRESAQDETRSLQRSPLYQNGQHDEQHEAFKQGFVELTGMAGHRPAARKHHCPGHITGPPPQLLADKVSQPAERETYRHQRCDKVPSRKMDRPRWRANSTTATTQPRNPP